MREPIAVRHLAAPDIHLVVDWAREEGWNPGINDAGCFYAADPGGFLASLNREEPAAVISLVRYDASFAFLGLYICRPDLRGQGYGFRVWEAAMASAGARTIALDGVPAQQENYARSGVELAWCNTRYEIQEGTGDDVPGLIDLDSVPFTDVTCYDADVFEADRRTFLRFWLAQPGASRLGIVHDGRLAGWGLLRPCAEGSKIGPLMADNRHVAELLLDGLCARGSGQPVFIDAPETNAEAVRLVEARGMTPCFETARMYRGTPPPIDIGKVWGLTTFELG